jgi:hypothetical protein
LHVVDTSVRTGCSIGAGHSTIAASAMHTTPVAQPSRRSVEVPGEVGELTARRKATITGNRAR